MAMTGVYAIVGFPISKLTCFFRTKYSTTSLPSLKVNTLNAFVLVMNRMLQLKLKSASTIDWRLKVRLGLFFCATLVTFGQF